MPAARRLELHRTIGRVLEDMYGGDLESHLAELAHHFTEAAPLGLAKEAVEYSVRAGDRAAAALAYENAAQHYGAAVQLLPLLEHASVERRCEILLALGDSHSGEQETRPGPVTASKSAPKPPRAQGWLRRWRGLPSDLGWLGSGWAGL